MMESVIVSHLSFLSLHGLEGVPGAHGRFSTDICEMNKWI